MHYSNPLAGNEEATQDLNAAIESGVNNGGEVEEAPLTKALEHGYRKTFVERRVREMMKKKEKQCSVPGCTNNAYRGNFCGMHYRNPLAGNEEATQDLNAAIESGVNNGGEVEEAPLTKALEHGYRKTFVERRVRERISDRKRRSKKRKFASIHGEVSI